MNTTFYPRLHVSTRVSYSVGFTLPTHTPDLLALIPEHVWAPALDAHDEHRDGAWVAELTGLLDLTDWPDGMRIIVRKERPHPEPNYGSRKSTGCESPRS